MPRVRFDHVALLVNDLEQAVRDYQDIFRCLGGEHVDEIVWDQGLVDGYQIRWATFVRRDGGTALQFLQSDHPRDQKLLARRGECVHHLAFCSTDVEQTAQELTQAGIPRTSEVLSSPLDKPWLKWTFIPPSKGHGVLIEVAQQYRVENGKWVSDGAN